MDKDLVLFLGTWFFSSTTAGLMIGVIITCNVKSTSKRVALNFFISVAIGCLMACLFTIEDHSDETKWNKGHCVECGGEWELFDIERTRNGRTIYYYECEDCQNLISTEIHFNQNRGLTNVNPYGIIKIQRKKRKELMIMFHYNHYYIIETKEEFLSGYVKDYNWYIGSTMSSDFNVEDQTFPLGLLYQRSWDPHSYGDYIILPVEEALKGLLNEYDNEIEKFNNLKDCLKEFAAREGISI